MAKNKRELSDASFELVAALRRRLGGGVSLKEIQAGPGLSRYKITKNDIIRMSEGEGCKKGMKRLRCEWNGDEMTVRPTPMADEYEGKRRRRWQGNWNNAGTKGWYAQDGSKVVEEQGANTLAEEAVNIIEGGNGEQEQEKGDDRIKERLRTLLRHQKQQYNLQGVWRGYVKIDEVLETPPMKDLGEQANGIKEVIKKNPDIFELEAWKKEEYIRLVWGEGPAEKLK